MAETGAPNGGRDPLLRAAAVIAVGVFLGLSVIVVVAQVVGRALIGPSYDVGDLLISGVFGTLVSLVLAVLGIKFINRDGLK